MNKRGSFGVLIECSPDCKLQVILNVNPILFRTHIFLCVCTFKNGKKIPVAFWYFFTAIRVIDKPFSKYFIAKSMMQAYWKGNKIFWEFFLKHIRVKWVALSETSGYLRVSRRFNLGDFFLLEISCVLKLFHLISHLALESVREFRDQSSVTYNFRGKFQFTLSRKTDICTAVLSSFGLQYETFSPYPISLEMTCENFY